MSLGFKRLILEDDFTTVLQDIEVLSPNVTESRPRILESSATPLWEPQILQRRNEFEV